MPAGQDCTGTKTKTKLLAFTLSLSPFTECATDLVNSNPKRIWIYQIIYQKFNPLG